MRWTYRFGEGMSQEDGGTGGRKRLLGGKGAALAEMGRLGLPVPPGFTVTTDACRAFLEDGVIPDEVWDEIRESLRELETAVGRRFGGDDEPLLLSVRSGAPFSMPGMMDTVLNLGLNDESAEALVRATGNEGFVRDSHRRLLQMYGEVVMGLPSEPFEEVLAEEREAAGVERDGELSAERLAGVVERFRGIIRERSEDSFPEDPWEQLRGGVEAVFRSWNTPRAISYRRVHRLPDDAGTAVNVQAMVFGNLGADCASGVAFTRNPSTGEGLLYGEFLVNAQGEDVVAGIRDPEPIDRLRELFAEAYGDLERTGRLLEEHYREMQDLEFTIERGTFYMLQARTGKRTAQAAVRIALDMLDEGLISQGEAVLRVTPEQLEQLLHPTIDPEAEEEPAATGLPGSPGAASGRAVFHPDRAEGGEGDDPVILVRRETSADDFHGMAAAAGILTSRGGMTSHAAVVARGMGKPAVVGTRALSVDPSADSARLGEERFAEGDWLTLDGATGRIFLGRVPTVEARPDERIGRLMELADGVRRIEVRANADTPEDARRARERGARGIGLCRTEHMFFGRDRIGTMRQMILARDREGRRAALDELLPFQRRDFLGILEEMDGLPVTIRLLDPPLHEFLPDIRSEIEEAAERLGMEPDDLRRAVERLREANPMLGHRGVRLGMTYPEITEMQARAIFHAAADAAEAGGDPRPEVMVPLVAHVAELRSQAGLVRKTARQVLEERGVEVAWAVGTMIELPRAALTAGEIAGEAEFFSFGTNDLTQTVFGISRDDSGSFLPRYLDDGIFPSDPFQTVDPEGVGRLLEIAVREGREARSDLELGVCGEHGGDPTSVRLFHRLGLDYVSCSPFRVPVARLAGAQAALREEEPRPEDRD